MKDIKSEVKEFFDPTLSSEFEEETSPGETHLAVLCLAVMFAVLAGLIHFLAGVH